MTSELETMNVRAANEADVDVNVAWLACAIGNDRAARFYEKCEWTRSGTIINNADTANGPFPLKVWRYEKSLIAAPPKRDMRG